MYQTVIESTFSGLIRRIEASLTAGMNQIFSVILSTFTENGLLLSGLRFSTSFGTLSSLSSLMLLLGMNCGSSMPSDMVHSVVYTDEVAVDALVTTCVLVISCVDVEVTTGVVVPTGVVVVGSSKHAQMVIWKDIGLLGSLLVNVMITSVASGCSGNLTTFFGLSFCKCITYAFMTYKTCDIY